MAGISTQVQLYDRVSGPMGNIVKSLNNAVTAFRGVQVAGGQVFNDLAYTRMKEEVDAASEALDKLANSQNNSANGQGKFNASLNRGSSLVGSLTRKVVGLVGTYASLRGAQKLASVSDNWTQTQARLGLVAREGESVVDMQNKIYQASQRSRSGMMDFAASVSKLGITAGKAFSSTDEIVAFSELMNKNFVIGGASQQESAAAMYQLTQAMASGRLQGDEYRSIIENAPLLASSIEDYMRNVQGVQGSMKDWASEGLLTADVIKAALFSSAEETEERFAKMPKTWGQIWTQFKNGATMAFSPVLQKVNDLANSEGVQNFVNNAINGLATVSIYVLQIFEGVAAVGNFIADNWSIIAPILIGAAIAMGLYTTALIIGKGVMLASMAITMLHTIFTTKWTIANIALATATFIQTVAQKGLNAALAACPLVWIIGLIIIVIAIIYAVCSAIAKMTGIANSGFGVITGGINVVIQFFKNLAAAVANIAIVIWNALGAVASNMVTAFHNSIKNIQSGFYGLLSTALHVVEGICAALNRLPFIEFDYSGISAKADEYAAKSAEYEGQKREYESIADEFNKGLNTFEAFKPGWVKEAFDGGAAWGDNKLNWLKDKTSGLFKPDKDKSLELDNYGNTPAVPEYAKDIGNIANDTSDIKKSVTASSEELKYLRMIAERQAINKFTTAEIKIDMTGMQNSISSEMDIDGVINVFQKKLTEAIVSSPKGVHV